MMSSGGGGDSSGGGGGGGAKVGCWLINPQKKLARTEAYPFRAPVRIGSGPTFYTNSSHGRWDDLCSSAQQQQQQQQQQQAQEEQEGDAATTTTTNSSSSDTTTHQSSSTSLAAAGVGMAVRLPAASFTSAQWQELEQQALIFKYMMASVPVPPHLLLPIKTSLSSDIGNGINPSTALECWGGLSARFGGGVDPEPGRCRRTDGKKWRCSRDVAPDQKYCERHMHRGRPRSRKPLEPAIVVQQQQQNSGMTAAMLPRPNSPVVSSSSSSFSGMKDPLQAVAGTDDKTNRYMDWMRRENAMSVAASAATQQWQLMQSKLGGFQDQRSHHQQFRSNSPSFLEYQDGLRLLSEPDHLRETTGFLAGLEHQASAGDTQPRQLIDAWSSESQWLPTTAAGNTNTKPGSNSKLSLSNLTLSMSGMRDEPEPVQADLGENESSAKPNWMMSAVSWQPQHCSPLGGPLAEALQCSNPVPASNNCSSNYLPRGVGLNLMRDGWSESSPQESPKVTVASPTRVLQRTLASFSDSSSGSSPTFSAPVEIALQWFNQCK